MKRLLLVASAGVVLMVAAPLVVTLTGGIGLAGTNSADCGVAGNPDVAMTGLVVGTRLQASERVLLAAMEAGLVESGMTIYANDGKRGPEDTAAVSDADLAEAATSLALPHAAVGSDHDSVGVLQQRRSWGTAAQRLDPAYAFGEFYKRAIPLDQAGFTGTAAQLAQAVQVSGFPDRYEVARPDAEALLASLGGSMPVGCVSQGGAVSPVPSGYGTPGPCGRSPSTDYARYLIRRTFGITNIGDCAPGVGHVENSDHYPDGNGQAHALDVVVSGRAQGDSVAAWATANHVSLNVRQIIWNGSLVTYDDGSGGQWHTCRDPGSSCARLHFGHIHIGFQEGT